MAEKKRVDIAKVEVFTDKGHDWLNVSIAVKAEELEHLVKEILGFVGGIPGLPGGGKMKGKIKISSEDLVAFATQLPIEQLENLVKALSGILVKRKHKPDIAS